VRFDPLSGWSLRHPRRVQLTVLSFYHPGVTSASPDMGETAQVHVHTPFAPGIFQGGGPLGSSSGVARLRRLGGVSSELSVAPHAAVTGHVTVSQVVTLTREK
jgi:hypothetical protein